MHAGPSSHEINGMVPCHVDDPLKRFCVRWLLWNSRN